MARRTDKVMSVAALAMLLACGDRVPLLLSEDTIRLEASEVPRENLESDVSDKR